MFSLPSPKLLGQFKQIETLERITIVDTNNELTPKRRSLLKRVFGSGVEIRVVQSRDSLPRGPKAFREHLIRVRQSVRRRYLDSEPKQ